jgi:hypothetical protein
MVGGRALGGARSMALVCVIVAAQLAAMAPAASSATTADRVITPASTTVTATFGNVVTLTGEVDAADVACAAGVVLTVRRDLTGDDSGYADVGETTTDADGNYATTFTAERNARVIVRAAADERCGSMESSAVEVMVRRKVALRASSKAVERGGRVGIRVRVLPARVGEKVLLYRSTDGIFRVIAVRETNEDGLAFFRPQVWRHSAFLAEAPTEDDSNLAGTSFPVAVEVR